MRRLAVLVAIVVLLALGLTGLFDAVLAPSFLGVGPGSYGLPPRTAGLELLPADASCDPTSGDLNDEPCPQRYAYRPAQTLVAWVSVRNDGPLAVTLRGVSRSWLEQFGDPAVIPLGKPRRGLDGGDPTSAGTAGSLSQAAFGDLTLAPGDERIVGLEFETLGDETLACRHWAVGSGTVWESVPVAWRWLVVEHTQEIPLANPIEFMAPAEADCA